MVMLVYFRVIFRYFYNIRICQILHFVGHLVHWVKFQLIFIAKDIQVVMCIVVSMHVCVTFGVCFSLGEPGA